MPLKYSVENSKNVIHLAGRLDTKTSAELHDEVIKLVKMLCVDDSETTAVDFRPDIVLDLKDVDYIGSLFLRICTAIMEVVGKEHLAIINTIPTVKKIFQIAGLDKLISIS